MVCPVKSDQFSRIRDLDSKTSVSSQVADHLSRLIADGLLSPGDKLPGETVLSRRLGVSRPTLREALGVLSARGLVEVRPRSGTYVCSVIPNEVVKAIDDLLTVDPAKTLPGRGAWLHHDPDCLQSAIRRRAFGRALRITGTPDITAVVERFASQGTPDTPRPENR